MSGIVSSGGRQVGIPASLRKLLLHEQHSLTTAQASGILGMSRQFFVDLLESGALPFHRVGNHRRVYLSDVLLYKQTRDRERRKILEQMVKSEAEEGLYDLIPENVQPRIRTRRRS